MGFQLSECFSRANESKRLVRGGVKWYCLFRGPPQSRRIIFELSTLLQLPSDAGALPKEPAESVPTALAFLPERCQEACGGGTPPLPGSLGLIGNRRDAQGMRRGDEQEGGSHQGRGVTNICL